MKILTLGMGAFGFSVNKILGEANKEKIFFVYEKNVKSMENLKKTREHLFFFKGYKLPLNIHIIKNIDSIISEVDLLIIAIPTQFISTAIDLFKNKLKPGVIILNLAKGIDIQNNKTISEIFQKKLQNFNYHYSILSGGMIASEVIEGKKLGADLGIKDFNKGFLIKQLFDNSNIEIKLRKDYLNIELYGSLKNIMAILVGYYEGKGNNFSTIGYFLSNYFDEIKDIIILYGGKEELDFSYYSLGGDIIATCFGNSRNRYFGYLLGKGIKIEEVLSILKKENKHAEGYETLKAVYEKVKDKKGFEITKKIYKLVK